MILFFAKLLKCWLFLCQNSDFGIFLEHFGYFCEHYLVTLTSMDIFAMLCCVELFVRRFVKFRYNFSCVFVKIFDGVIFYAL